MIILSQKVQKQKRLLHIRRDAQKSGFCYAETVENPPSVNLEQETEINKKQICEAKVLTGRKMKTLKETIAILWICIE